MDIVHHLYRQRAFSRATFGPGKRKAGIIDHIRKELVEVEAEIDDTRELEEWIDVIILAFDGAWRTGAIPEQVAQAIRRKQDENELRDWPDWCTQPPDRAIEHRRGCPHCGAAHPPDGMCVS
jgi:hypothetical protein